MSLIDLPTELLIEITEYLRPVNKCKPITGKDASWRLYSDYLASLKLDTQQICEPLLSFATLRALSMTCKLLRGICVPLLFEDLDIVKPIECFGEFHTTVLVSIAPCVRNIRISRKAVTDKQAADILNVCQGIKTLALYGMTDDSDDTNTTSDLTGEAIVGLFEGGNLDTLGIYYRSLMEIDWGNDTPSALSFLEKISKSHKGRIALRHLDVALNDVDQQAYDLIRTAFPSLQSITCFDFIEAPLQDVWDPHGTYNWAPYSNLTRLQFRECKRVRSRQISHLVRHFPSLTHLLVSACDYGEYRHDNVRPKGWYERDDALWKVHKPLETFQLEHTDEDEIMVMGDIPTTTLIIANLGGDHLTRSLMKDDDLFPGLRCIRIEPPVILGLEAGVHPFTDVTLAILEVVCQRRQIKLTRDAEATRLEPRHY